MGVGGAHTIVKKQNFPGFERYATRDKWAISFISPTMPKVGYNMRKILAGKSDPHKLGFTVLYFAKTPSQVHLTPVQIFMHRCVDVILNFK